MKIKTQDELLLKIETILKWTFQKKQEASLPRYVDDDRYILFMFNPISMDSVIHIESGRYRCSIRFNGDSFKFIVASPNKYKEVTCSQLFKDLKRSELSIPDLNLYLDETLIEIV